MANLMFRFVSVGRWPRPCSTMSQPNIYQQLFEAYCKAYPDKKKETCQKELNKEWESIKSSSEYKPLLIKPKAEENLKKLTAIAAKKRGGLI